MHAIWNSYICRAEQLPACVILDLGSKFRSEVGRRKQGADTRAFALIHPPPPARALRSDPARSQECGSSRTGRLWSLDGFHDKEKHICYSWFWQ